MATGVSDVVIIDDKYCIVEVSEANPMFFCVTDFYIMQASGNFLKSFLSKVKTGLIPEILDFANIIASTNSRFSSA